MKHKKATNVPQFLHKIIMSNSCTAILCASTLKLQLFTRTKVSDFELIFMTFLRKLFVIFISDFLKFAEISAHLKKYH